jgi:hypothetical protein
MKRGLFTVLLILGLAFPMRMARADIWGGDVVVLTQILANAVQQLIQLRQILSTGEDNLALLQDINRGLNDILGVANTVGKVREPGLYGDVSSVHDGQRMLKEIYGQIPDSSESKVQDHSDQVVSEALTLNNSLYEYTKDIDAIGEEIKQASAIASPKGAQRLTVESLGVMLTVMNQSLRAQASGLKLQAQAMAAQNHKDKRFTKHVRESAKKLNDAMNRSNPEFKIPHL